MPRRCASARGGRAATSSQTLSPSCPTPAVNFWAALWNSIYSSFLIAASVVITSTLAGWAFAKLRFLGGPALLAFVVATMAVPQQLGVVPLYILFSDLGWTGSIEAPSSCRR